ncbi:MAG: diaminopimelate decarboxylase [Gammaproteobacteria bacterium]|nr:MAG: diaminopimelate decarboxylase [Gammaproteobacteria bacterium]
MIPQPLPYVSNETLHQIANDYGTPVYVYDAQLIKEKFNAYQQAFAGRRQQICYAVKANSNLAVLNYLADLGAGFDIVSVGELQRVLMAGGQAEKTIFSSVGKQIEEIAFALEVGIAAFDVESLEELDTIIAVAKEMGEVAPISIRFNPDVDAKTHPYISTGLKDNKFGLTAEPALQAYRKARDSRYTKVVGINMHIGSQITDLSAFSEAMLIQSQFIQRLKDELNISLTHINVGGGIGVKYDDEDPIDIRVWAEKVKQCYPDNEVMLVMEPGRSIVANAGVLLTRAIYQKTQSARHFCVVDAAMNDYARVALYQSYNLISNLSRAAEQPLAQDIVGPVCESTDCFAKARRLDVVGGDLLAIHDTGAYGFAMASNYNSRGRAAEVLAEGDDYHLIRRRETFEDIIAAELVGQFELENLPEDN